MNPDNKETAWQGLVNIANGKSDLVDNGSSSAYQNYSTADKKASDLYNYYMQNMGSFDSDQRDTASELINNAQLEADTAKSYYQQYLENTGMAQDAKMAQYQAQQNALKYAQNSLNASGLGTQGIAESTMAGYNNQYSRNVADIDAAYVNANNQNWEAYQRMINETRSNSMDALSNYENLTYSNLINDTSKGITDAKNGADAIASYEKNINAAGDADRETLTTTLKNKLGDSAYNAYQQGLYNEYSTVLSALKNRLGVNANRYTEHSIMAAANLLKDSNNEGKIIAINNKNNKEKAAIYKIKNGKLEIVGADQVSGEVYNIDNSGKVQQYNFDNSKPIGKNFSYISRQALESIATEENNGRYVAVNNKQGIPFAFYKVVDGKLQGLNLIEDIYAIRSMTFKNSKDALDVIQIDSKGNIKNSI